MAISGRSEFLKAFPDALHKSHGAFFVWAGVSVAAGYPRWSDLLLIAAGR